MRAVLVIGADHIVVQFVNVQQVSNAVFVNPVAQLVERQAFRRGDVTLLDLRHALVNRVDFGSSSMMETPLLLSGKTINGTIDSSKVPSK